MVRDNLFTALRRYRTTPDRNPREDFITEAFAWLLRRHDQLGKAVLDHFAQGIRQPGWPADRAARWRTQVVFERGPVERVGDAGEQRLRGRLDMVAEVGEHAIVCEHKVWSSLSSGQLEAYRAAAKELWPRGHTLVLITANARQHQPGADLALTWADIYQLVARWLQSHAQSAELVEDFLGLLADEGLAPPAPVSHESILSFLPASTFEGSMLAVVRKVVEADWRWLADRVATRNVGGPYLRGSRPEGICDGRLGVDLLPGWRPGIFLGVILDGTDHRVKPSEPLKGPDFSLVLSYTRDEGAPPRDLYLDSPEFKDLQRRLASDARGWDYADTREHPWHPIHLRRPLLDVFRGTLDFDGQVEQFIACGREAIEVLLAGGELEALRARLGAP